MTLRVVLAVPLLLAVTGISAACAPADEESPEAVDPTPTSADQCATDQLPLLEPGTLTPMDVADEVIAEVVDADAGAGWVGGEFLKAQVEFSSPVLSDGDGVERVVREFRRVLGGAAARTGPGRRQGSLIHGRDLLCLVQASGGR